MTQCECSKGSDPDDMKLCGRKATHRGSDDEGNSWALCRDCAKNWDDLNG